MELSTLRDEIVKVPFAAFTLRLSDGTSVHVPHRELIAIAPPRTVFVGKENGGYETLDALHIVAMDRSAPSRRTKGRNGPKGG
jgi:hypothetical protein